MAALDIWCVATAVLLNKASEMHYNDIADKILASGLTNLAKKGQTPEQTVGAMLRTRQYRNKNVFKKTGEGYYALAQPQWAKSIPEVQQAIRLMSSGDIRFAKQAKKVLPSTEDVSCLRARIAKLDLKPA